VNLTTNAGNHRINRAARRLDLAPFSTARNILMNDKS
jgi:hypothetical protein